MDDNNQPRRAIGARPKLAKLPNPINEPKRAKRRGTRQGEEPVQQQPVQQVPMSKIPPFDANSEIMLDWTLLEGIIADVINQVGDSCASVVLCRLLQAYHNRDKVVALHHKFSTRDLTDYVEKKCGKLLISNMNIASDYIVDCGLLKEPEGRTVKASGKGHRVKARFEVKTVSRDDVYEILENSTLAICLDTTPELTALGAEEIYDVPLDNQFAKQKDKNEQLPTHCVLVVGRGRDTKTGKEFLVIQNSWGKKWCNHGYGRIWLNPAGKFEIFWPVEVLKQ